MPNGKPGDHPLTDVLVHGLEVFGPRADALIREIVSLDGRSVLERNVDLDQADLRSPHPDRPSPSLQNLEHRLTLFRDALRDQHLDQ